MWKANGVIAVKLMLSPILQVNLMMLLTVFSTKLGTGVVHKRKPPENMIERKHF